MNTEIKPSKGYELGLLYNQTRIKNLLTKLDMPTSAWDRTNMEEQIEESRLRIKYLTVRRERGIL